MDPVIHSQIQNKLFRIFQSIPTDMSSFLHTKTKRAPPYSLHREIVRPYEGQGVTESDRERWAFVSKFKIPSKGHLNRMMLQFRRESLPALLNRIDDSFGESPYDLRLGAVGSPLHGMNFADSIDFIELRTETNVIETLYPEAIPFEVMKLCRNEQMLHEIFRGMQGYPSTNSVIFSKNDNVRATGISSQSVPSFVSPVQIVDHKNRSDSDKPISYPFAYSENDFLSTQFAVPLPFSCTRSLADNFQTQFVEELYVHVYFKRAPAADITLKPNFNSAAVKPLGHGNIELVLKYHNFYDPIERELHEMNYKQGIPAALLFNDYHRMETGISSTIHNLTSHEFRFEYQLDLPGDALLSDIYLIPKYLTKTTHDINEAKLDKILSYASRCIPRDFFLYYTLSSSDGYYLEGNHVESLLLNNHLHEALPSQHLECFPPNKWFPNLESIKLEHHNNERGFNGGLSLASLTNPVLRIYVGFNKVDELVNFYTPESISFTVILKRKHLLRIDSETGVISKSLES